MKIGPYFKDEFPHHMRRLHFKHPNRIVSVDIMGEPGVLFFGGQDWRNVERDLQEIPGNYRPAFVFSLFVITLTDQCIHSHFKESYPRWRSLTNFPKFGWAGFGYHMLNLRILHWAPVEWQALI